MQYTYKQGAAPTVLPLSLTEVKQHLRIDGSDEDSVLDALIQTACDYCQNFQNRFYINTPVALYLQALPIGKSIPLPRPPLVSVESVTIRYTDGTTDIIAASNYEVHAETEEGVIVFNTDYTVVIDSSKTLMQVNPYVINYTAGYGATRATVPNNVKHAMLLLIGHWFNMKEDSLPGVMISKIPKGADTLLTLDKFAS